MEGGVELEEISDFENRILEYQLSAVVSVVRVLLHCFFMLNLNLVRGSDTSNYYFGGTHSTC